MNEKAKELTKAEQKELEIKNRQRFTRNAFDLVLKMISSATKKTRKTFNVKITLQNTNRYINFLAYGHSFKISIFKDGNIELELKEVCHDDFRAQLFEFTMDETLQAVFLKHFKNILSWLIPVFMEEDPHGVDSHSYMDFVERIGDFEKAYREAVREFTTEYKGD